MKRLFLIVILALVIGETRVLGIRWYNATSAAGWSARSGHTSVVYDGKMWVIGGSEGWAKQMKNDVWWSMDGVTWIEATPSAEWSQRAHHASVVYNGKMWVMGGTDLNNPPQYNRNDVWWSTDGVAWFQATANADWTGGDLFSATVFDGKMWILGGNDNGTVLYDVWYSTNGVNWTRAADFGGFVRNSNPLVEYDSKMWVLGGRGFLFSPPQFEYYNDVWYSPDGVSWTRDTQSAPWRKRWGHTSVMYNNRMWVLGGDSVFCFNDVWYSDAIPPEVEERTYLQDEILISSITPNPFNYETRIRYKLPKATEVCISIYNLIGQQITTLVNEYQSAGWHTAIWDSGDKYDRLVGSGVYFYHINSGKYNKTGKLYLIR
ncbi:MAG: T9SS type A sorting domain-containing protein [bacterium]|nr:T9SS type A sorting domain-containing protein [bacterium]